MEAVITATTKTITATATINNHAYPAVYGSSAGWISRDSAGSPQQQQKPRKFTPAVITAGDNNNSNNR